MFEQVIQCNLVWGSLHLINLIPYNLIFTTKFNDSSILITITS